MGDDSNGECGVPMASRFTMPQSPGSNSIFWYGFDYGSVHFTMISTEHDLSPGSSQYKWLNAELASVDRARTPWLVVSGHRPVYNSEKYDSDYRVSENFKTLFEPLLVKYKVSITFFGHYHSYERTCPVAFGNCTEFGSGPVHITIGSAGASLDTAGLYGLQWSEFFDDDWGIGSVTVANRSAMHFEYLRSRDNRLADDAWVYQSPADSPYKTTSGCHCKQPWGADGGYGWFYECRNPTGDRRGSWCYVQEGAGSSCNPKHTGAMAPWDWCDTPAVQITQRNCTCKSPFIFDGLKFYNGTDRAASGKFRWCYVGEEKCGIQGEGGWWDQM
jgi:hypothetical protein